MKITGKQIRLIVAVLAGVVVSKILDLGAHWLLHIAGVLPPISEPNFSDRDHSLLLIIHGAFTVVSAILTAVIAKEQSRRATTILGTKEVIFWLIGSILLWNHSPLWVNLLKALAGPALCWIGWKIYRIHRT